MRSSDWVRARVQKIDLYSPPSVASGGRILLRPYNRVRAILRNTHAIPRPGTCGPSKNYPVFVSFGAVCGAYAIRPYDRVRAALQKTVLFSSSSGTLVGRIRYTPTTGYVRPFKKLSRFRHRRWRMVGRIQYAPTTGYVQFFEIPMGSLDRRGEGVWDVGR